MKKIFTLILMLIYITASAGVVLNVHYCMGKVSSVEIDNFSDKVCKCGDASSEMSCCFSELKVVKLEDAHKAAVVADQFQIPVAHLPTVLSLIDISKANDSISEAPVANSPPHLVSSNEIYLLNRVFRI